MFFKKSRKRVIENNKFNVKDTVSFRYKNDLKIGIILNIFQDDNDIISYEINVGGECPYVVIVEEKSIVKKLS